MRAMPLDIGLIHFVGIGGIGMSGIAEILHNLGYQVQGSDIAENANVRRLRELGIRVEIGHAAENVADVQVVVISSAVKQSNPEVRAARDRFVPVVRRAEMLGELMRLKWSIAVGGTHGKTTTTSMVASFLDTAGIDPTVINGGIINAYGTNARLGAGDWMVVEADESDGTFIKLPATIAVVTNIDPEHLDFYGDVEGLHAAFEMFVENIPFYGFAVLCIDHPAVQQLIGRVRDRRIITYGVSPQADVRLYDLEQSPEGSTFSVELAQRGSPERIRMEGLHLPMLGQHNVLNALAAIAVSQEMGMDEPQVREALASFKGVKRRFTQTGMVDGVSQTVLQQRAQSFRVGRDRRRVLDDQRRRRRVDDRPRLPREVPDVRRLRLLDLASLPGQRQRRIHEVVHPIERLDGLGEVIGVVLLDGQFDVPPRDVQGVPEVVAHDGGELVQPLVLPPQRLGPLGQRRPPSRAVHRRLDVRREHARQLLVRGVDPPFGRRSEGEHTVVTQRRDEHASVARTGHVVVDLGDVVEHEQLVAVVRLPLDRLAPLVRRPLARELLHPVGDRRRHEPVRLRVVQPDRVHREAQHVGRGGRGRPCDRLPRLREHHRARGLVEVRQPDGRRGRGRAGVDGQRVLSHARSRS